MIAKHMHIPTFLVFDADSDEQNPERRSQHEIDNKAILALVGMERENPMPTASLWGTGFVMWHSNIGVVVRGDIGTAEWQSYQAEADRQYGHAGKLKKNTLHIGASLAHAWADGKRSPSLARLCEAILNPASSV